MITRDMSGALLVTGAIVLAMGGCVGSPTEGVDSPSDESDSRATENDGSTGSTSDEGGETGGAAEATGTSEGSENETSASAGSGDADGSGNCFVSECDDPPSDACLDAMTLEQYEGPGTCTDGGCSYPPQPIECALGCCTDHCCELEPSNAESVGSLAPTGTTVGPPSGVFDTVDDCLETSTLGRCELVPRAGVADLCVCRADAFVIEDLKVQGEAALALLAWDTIDVLGTLDVSANGPGSPGPGAAREYARSTTGTNGGSGGSFGSRGAGEMARPEFGGAEQVPLEGGMRGQDACGGATGGGGGGALQLTAGREISISGTLDASGGGGAGGSQTGTCLGGAGGGSGGGLLIEAPRVFMTGFVFANGGGGGGGGNNQGLAGSSGGTSPHPRDPGVGGDGRDGRGCPLEGYTRGGAGGSGATSTSPSSAGEPADEVAGCIGGPDRVGGGGGGGGLGRIRVNTLEGCQCNGIFSPEPRVGEVGVQ